MIQGQLKDMIARHEVIDYEKEQDDNVFVAYGEDEDISLFDANLIRGMLERQPPGINAHINLAEFPAEHDPLIALIQREYEMNMQRGSAGPAANSNMRMGAKSRGSLGRKDAVMKN